MNREGMGDEQRTGHHRLDDETRRLGPRSERFRYSCECDQKGPWRYNDAVAFQDWTVHVREAQKG